MKKLLTFLVLFLSTFVYSQSCINGSNGTNGHGSQAPGVPCIYSFTYPYAGDITQAQVCTRTTGPADYMIETYYTVNSYDAPDANRYAYYDATRSTDHCGVITKLMPGGKTYAYGVANDGSTTNSGPFFGFNRVDPNYSTAPWGNGNSNGLTFTTANPTGSTFTFNSFPAGGPENIYAGTQWSTMAYSNQWLTGTQSVAPAYMFVSAVSVDTQSCTFGAPIMACGTTGISLQQAADNSSLPRTGTSNYNTNIAQSGTYTGHPFCSNGGMSCFGEGINYFRIMPSGSLGNGAHTIHACIQATDSGQNNIGSAVCFDYNFNVLANPSFTITNPTSYPIIANLNLYYTYLARNGIPDALQMINEEINLPGQYVNDNFSSSLTVGPYGMWNYDGARVAYGISDQLGAIAINWLAGHSYQVGDVICTSGLSCNSSPNFVQVATTAGVSGGTRPSWNTTVGGTTRDNTVTWTNVGNVDFWSGSVAERIEDQVRDWQLFHDHYTTDEEWNRFTDGNMMHCFRFENPCNSSTSEARADEFFLYPFIVPSGGWATVPQRIQWNYVQTERDTMRDREYEGPALYNYWLMFGSKPIDHSVDELEARTEKEFDQIEEVINYNPKDGHPYTPACCIGSPSFDVGLVAEDLIHTATVEHYESQPIDARIPIEIGKLLDWTYSNEWNLTGSDYNMPYTLWLIPYGPQMYNYEQSDLDMLLAPAYAWYGAVNGGTSCTLPTSHASCWTVADLMFQKTFANVSGTSKEFSQIYKWMADYFCWRNGTCLGSDSSILPNHNTLRTPYTPIEPYPQSQYALDVGVSNISGNGATVKWYNTQSVTSTLVEASTSSSFTNPITSTCGANSLVAGSDNMYSNTCDITGLNSSSAYFIAVGGTNSHGTAKSAYDILYESGSGQCYQSSGCSNTVCNNDPHLYMICTGISTGLSIITTTLPAGIVGNSYTGNLAGQGGIGPYTWVISAGSLPTGLTLGTCTTLTCSITGTPSASGVFSFTIELSDSQGHHAFQPLSITITANIIVSPPSCGNGRTGNSYSCTFSASGGTSPYTFSIIGCFGACIGTPKNVPGLTLSGNVESGFPTTTGSYSIIIKATDANGQAGQKGYPIQITQGGSVGGVIVQGSKISKTVIP